MKKVILTGWNWGRVLRLVIGIAALAQGIFQKDNMMLVAGSILTVGAMLNYGCNGRASCSLPATAVKKETKEKDYDELPIK
jgi:hypothetical protein